MKTGEETAGKPKQAPADWWIKFRELAEALVIAVIIALFIRAFVVQAFKIPSGSMLPTLQIGDHLLVNRFIYGIRLPFTGTLLIPVSEPKRDDVVVFRFPPSPDTDYIKRVIGLPGDTVEIRDKVVYINGEKVADPHAHFTDGMTPDITRGRRDEFGPVTVPPGHLFVMGDNRDNSYDSRFWGFVPDKNVLGKAFILYWSWNIDKNLLSPERFSSIRWSRIGDLIH
ncbi:MAG TPA: signal peptidase I [Desulfobulbaceae bacterium]|nr:signal peptidase I [Desulfobulbaceae bacterium]